MRQFGISRVTFREMANQGLIPGVKKHLGNSKSYYFAIKKISLIG